MANQSLSEETRDLFFAGYYILQTKEFQMLRAYCNKHDSCFGCAMLKLEPACPCQAVNATTQLDYLKKFDDFIERTHPGWKTDKKPKDTENRLQKILKK